LPEPRLTSFADYLRVLRRRWWILLLATLIAVGSGYAYSKQQTPQFQADSVVRLSAQPITQLLNNNHQSSTSTAVFVGNEAAFATSPAVVQATTKALHQHGVTTTQFLKLGSVKADSTNAILTFAYRARTAAQAVAGANAWAQQYKQLADQRDTTTVADAIAPLNAKLAKIKQSIQIAQAKGENATVLALGQLQRTVDEQILTLQGLQRTIAGNRQLTDAQSSSKVRPMTSRNLLAGGALGIIIGLVLIGLLESLDTRVRSTDEFGEVLGTPLLSRIPTPTRAMRKDNRLAMADDDDPRYSEAYRKLRVNFDFANVRTQARTVMVTSALEQEGKSTTIANLAIAMARAGRRVTLVDLDLRRPILHKFFGLEGRAGFSDVAMNHAQAGDALHVISIPGATGQLSVMPAGPPPPNPADFLESPVVGVLLDELSSHSDVVLIDSAPVLPVSDSVALSAKVDGVLAVVPAGAKRQIVSELHRVFSSSQTPLLGFILTASEHETDGYYGSGSYYGAYGGETGHADSTNRASAVADGRPHSAMTDSANGSAGGSHIPRPESV
jgi:succinoglycan biosynthesis transport protein ExoP